jgi:hypothetical protein
MGAGSSFLDLPEERREEIFKEMKDIYETDYLSQVSSGKIKEGEGYSIFREKLEKLLDSKNLNQEAFFKDEPDIFHSSPFSLGDIVKARDGGLMFEGVVVNFTNGMVEVDFGDAIEPFTPENCSLVKSGLEFEVGDKVQFQPKNMALHFCAEIIAIDEETLLADLRIDGDDPDDIEYGVEFGQMVKIKTGRELTDKFKKGIKMIQAVNRISGMFTKKGASGDFGESKNAESKIEEKEEKN